MLRHRIAEVAKAQGVSGGRLSRLADVSLTRVYEILKDPFSDCRLSTIQQFAKALNVDAKDLLIEAEPEMCQ